jgi:hypothetical protein
LSNSDPGAAAGQITAAAAAAAAAAHLPTQRKASAAAQQHCGMPVKLRFAMICASNNNRSMEAHRVLKENNFNVRALSAGLQSSLTAMGLVQLQANLLQAATYAAAGQTPRHQHGMAE